MTNTKTQKGSTSGGVLAGAIVLAILALIVWFWWDSSAWYLGTQFVRWFDGSKFFWVIAGLPIVLVIGAFFSFMVASDGSSAWGGIGVMLLVGAILTPILGFKPAWRSEWHTYQDYGSAVTESTKIPDWQMRVNRPQARIDIERNLGSTRGQLSDPSYVPDSPHGPAWCATVTAEATLGRTWTTAVACRYDILDNDPTKVGKVKVARFPAATVGAVGASWSSKLENQVAELDRGAHFREADMYGYLDKNNKPRLVLPITKLGGSFTHLHELPAGVVEFGPDGKPHLYEDVARVGIPGPVMPMIIAEEIRKGLNARDGLVSFDKPNRNKDAYQSTSDGDISDPNSDNPTEFVLRRCDPDSTPSDRPADSTTPADDCKNPRVVYVTPLTPYGTGRNVTAYLEVEADVVHAGKLPKATLYRLPKPQAATGTIAQTIASLYDADLAWATDNNGGGSDNHARLFELTPTGPDALVATIGVGNRSLYRLYIDPTTDGDGAFGQICVHVYSTDKRIRCDMASDQPVPVGSLRGIASSAPATSDPGNNAGTGSFPTITPADPNAPATPLDTVSTADLIAELNRRAQSGGL